MALQKQVIEVPFAKGVNQKSDPRWVPVGEQTSVLNGKWTKTGTLRKRKGFTAISKVSLGGGTLTAGAAVEGYKGTIAVSDGSNIYTYSSSKSLLSYQDQLPECIAQRTGIAQSTYGVTSCDVAATGNFACYAYRAKDVSGTFKVYAVVLDVAGGTTLSSSAVVDTAPQEGLRLIAMGSKFYLFYSFSTSVIKCATFDTSVAAPVWGTNTLVNTLSTASTPGAWDVSVINGATNDFVIAFQESGAPDDIRVQTFNSSLSNLASTSFTIGGGSLPVRMIALSSTFGETCWVAYATTDTVTTTFIRCKGLNASTLAATVADTLVWTVSSSVETPHLGVARVNSTTCLIAASNTTTPTLPTTPSDASWQQFNTSAALVGPKRQQQGYMMWSKPVAIGSQVLCMFYKYGSTTDQTFQLVDLIASDTSSDSAVARPVATIAPRQAANIAGMIISPSIAQSGISTATQYYVPVVVQQSTTRVGVWHTTLDFSSPQRHQAVELGESLYVAGGVPSVFDGSQAVEHGFLAAPQISQTSVSANGSVDVGQHQYALILKWVNSRGELMRSEPVFSGQVTTTSGSPGNQTVTISIPYVSLTTKQDAANQWTPAITFDLYRNTVNDPSTFWQISADSNESVNDPRLTGNISIVDTLSDSGLTTSAIGTLYTLGGVLADQCPSSLTCLCTHKNRVFGVGDDGLTLWFTKQSVTGFVPGFNDELSLQVPEDGGIITGLASLDDHLIVFKRDRIFALYGTGPNVTGQQSDFTDFVRLASDTGCTQSRSVVVAPAGVYFQSPQGIYLLTRGGECVYVGKAVEDAVASNPVCLAADIVDVDGEIRWCLAPSVFSATGIIVAYDYIQDSWSVHQYYDSDKAQASAIAKGARCVAGTWAWIGAGGLLNVESTSFLDGSQWVPLQVETAWIKANGIAGWGRFWRGTLSMEQATPFQLTLDVATNYSDSYGQTLMFSDATIATWTTAKPICSVMIGDQRTEAVRFRFTDASPATLGVGTGEGPRFLGANVEVGVKPGTKGTRIASAQRG